MEHVRLGFSDLLVSRICLGTMTFGAQCDEATSFEILDTAAESGVTFLDTADVYPARGVPGTTEEIVGRWIKGKRDRFVLAGKCGGQFGPDPEYVGCSRKHILRSVEDSLRRLGTDHLDLYQLHQFDPDTPIDETLGALDSLVRSGKVRHIGCSNWATSQLGDALDHSDSNELARFCSIQPRYNLLHRVAERALFPLCVEQRVGVLTYNPLAGGLLTGKHDAAAGPASDTRFSLSPVYRNLYWHDDEFATTRAIAPLAHELGLALATLAVAWSLAQPAITAAIIGASRAVQLGASIAAADVTLDDDVLRELDRVTARHLEGPAI